MKWNGKSSIWGLGSAHAIITLHTCHMIDTKANPRTDRYLSGYRSVLGVLKYRPNRSTEPIGNSERVEPNRPKHAIYRSGPVRESVDRPNANSDYLYDVQDAVILLTIYYS